VENILTTAERVFVPIVDSEKQRNFDNQAGATDSGVLMVKNLFIDKYFNSKILNTFA